MTEAAAAQETLEFSSNPAGADIEVDGSFVGTTPSSIAVAPGDHAITIRKSGYKTWERKMKTSSGNVKVVADLEQETKAEAVKPEPVNGDAAKKE